MTRSNRPNSKLPSPFTQSITKTHPILHLLILCVFLGIGNAASTINGAPVVRTINANTTYQFTILDDALNVTTSTTAVIQISFSSTFFSFNTGATFSCFSTTTPSLTYPCRASATNTIQIDNPRSSSIAIGISVSSIKNPSSTEAVTFVYTFKDGASILSQSTSEAYRSYSAGSLQGCIASFSPNTVHSTSEITLTITLGNQVKRNGSISVTFPSNWPNSANSSFAPIISTLTQGCTKRSTNTLLTSTLSCMLLGQQIILTNSLNNTAAAGSQLSFSISNILSPPTVWPGYSVQVTTLTESNTEIDKTTCILDPVLTKSIANVNTNTQLVVGTNTSFVFSFLAPTPITADDRLILSAQSPNDSFFSLAAAGSVYVLYNAIVLSVESSSASSVTLVFPSTMSSAIPASTKIDLMQGLSVKPLVSSGTKSLTLTLRRNNFEFGFQSFGVSIGSNLLLSTSIQPGTSTVSSLSDYSFTFTLANPLGAKSRILITLPGQLSMPNGACARTISAVTNPSNLNSSSTCTVTSNRVIQLGSVTTNTLLANQKLTISVSGITNSQTTQTTSFFTIQTYYSDTISQITDRSIDKTVTMTPAVIGVASVSSSSPMVSQQSTYTFSYTVKTKFLPNSSIRLKLPPDVVIGTSLLSAKFSILHTNGTLTGEQSCSILNNTINSVQYLSITGVSAQVLPANTVITLKITPLVNPNSMKPSGSFGLSQLDSKGFEIQSLETGLTVTNSQFNAFPVFYAGQKQNRVNGQTSSYVLNFRSSVDLAVNDYLLVELSLQSSRDTQIQFSNPISSCSIVYNLNGVDLSVSNTIERRSSTLLKINLNQQLSSSTPYQMTINSIVRSRTQQLPSTLTLRSYRFVSSSSTFGISSSTLQPKQNNKKNVIDSVSLNIVTSPSQLLSFQTFTLRVVLRNVLMSGDYLVIQVPRLYSYWGSLVTIPPSTNLSSVASQSLCVESDYFCSHLSNDAYKIKVEELSTAFSSTTSVSFTIKNNLYRSPSTFQYSGYYFKGSSYSANNFMIDETITSGTLTTNLANAEFYLTCRTNLATYHCQTCNPLTNTCLSCYQPTTLNSTLYSFEGFKFLTSQNKCVSECGTGFFINSANNICTKCDTPCLTCQSTSSSCLSCIPSLTTNHFFSANKTCLSACPDSYYPDPANICLSCSSSCATCQSDAMSCTSCPSGTFLNSVSKSCVVSTLCPFGTFADSNLNKCSTCSSSCLGCSSSSTNCLSCAGGYIVDFSNSTFKNCTNRCPTGTVNDTLNNLGCRCEAQCKTCQNSVSTCKSCDSLGDYKFLYSSTCLITCPQGTYTTKITGTTIDTCIDCPDSNCNTCNQTTCLQCSNNYALSNGICLQTCPNATLLQINNGLRQCTPCPLGCLACDLGTNKCTTCQTGYLRQSNSSGTFCVTVCTSPLINFNNSICYSNCPDGYQNLNQVCKLKQSNTTVITQASSQLTKTRTVPFPFLIASVILITIILLSKAVLVNSLVSTLLTVIVGLLEPLSWIVVVGVAWTQTGQGNHWAMCSIGTYLLIAALILNLILNIIALVFYHKYVAKDTKFGMMLSYNDKKVLFGKCPTTTTLILSLLFSHKLLQLLFSNFLYSRHFSYKLQTVSKLLPLNYVLYASILPSCLAIAGGSIISYELQNYTTQSSSFIAAIDMILITLIGIIASMWVTNRKNQDYENQIDPLDKHPKHYQTEEILVDPHGPQDFSQNFNEVFLQQSGVRKNAQDNQKNYYYQSSRISQKDSNHDNDPLTKRATARRPLNKNQSNKKSKGLNAAEQSSQALVINERQKRLNLKEQFQSNQSFDHNPKRHNEDSDLEVIDLEKSNPLNSKMNYLNNKEKKEKPEELLKMSTEQKQELKNKIQSQLEDDEKQKLKVLSRERDLKIRKKKEQLEKIIAIDQSKDTTLTKEDKSKIQKIKQAVDLLKRKQIKIEEYLLYTEIIKQEEGEYDQDTEYDRQISQINEKAHTIIRGIQDEDQQLEQVIKLSPKKKLIQSDNNKNTKELSPSKSKEKNSPSKSKERYSNSKQKTIRKQSNNNEHKRHHKRGNAKLNDLQVNYDLNGVNSQNQDEDSFDYEKQPELPKTRSNIVHPLNKSRNRSQKQINPKKTLPQGSDMVMIDLGTNRHNMTENQISRFGGTELDIQRTDSLPPNHLRSTQKVEYKNRNFDDLISRNIVDDSENDRETMKSFDQADLDFQNQVSPSHFDVQNQRFDYVDESKDMPVKPTILADPNQHDTTIDKNNNRRKNNDGFGIYEADEIEDQFGPHFKGGQANMNHTMSRYSSTNSINYDALLRKNVQNQKLKQLEKIYLPSRADSRVAKKTKRDLSLSKINVNKSKQ